MSHSPFADRDQHKTTALRVPSYPREEVEDDEALTVRAAGEAIDTLDEAARLHAPARKLSRPEAGGKRVEHRCSRSCDQRRIIFVRTGGLIGGDAINP